MTCLERWGILEWRLVRRGRGRCGKKHPATEIDVQNFKANSKAGGNLLRMSDPEQEIEEQVLAEADRRSGVLLDFLYFGITPFRDEISVYQEKG